MPQLLQLQCPPGARSVDVEDVTRFTQVTRPEKKRPRTGEKVEGTSERDSWGTVRVANTALSELVR